jgi:hypothetical protein
MRGYEEVSMSDNQILLEQLDEIQVSALKALDLAGDEAGLQA